MWGVSVTCHTHLTRASPSKTGFKGMDNRLLTEMDTAEKVGRVLGEPVTGNFHLTSS